MIWFILTMLCLGQVRGGVVELYEFCRDDNQALQTALATCEQGKCYLSLILKQYEALEFLQN